MRAVLLAMALILGAVAPAHAFESMLQDDDALLHSGPEGAVEALRELRELGVDRIRVNVNWAAVAPGRTAEPAPGALAAHDHLLREATARGMAVLLTITGGPATAAPPDPATYGRFVEALGRRWPQVTAWSLWNEPNWGGHLQPQWGTVKERVRVAPRGRGRARTRVRRRWVMRSPALYRALHRAGAAGLQRSGHGGDTILLGETAPRGDRRKGPTRAIRPVEFLAQVLCLDPRRLKTLRGRAARDAGCDDFRRHGPLPATGLAHHPYGVIDAPGTPTAHLHDAGLADAARLLRVLDAGARAGRVRAGLPLWWTEHGYETNPPDPRRGIDPEQAARWLAEAERIARATPRVVAHTHFLLRDTPLDTRFATSDRRHFRTYQSGLRYADGAPKPALAAFRLPLAAPERVAPGAPVPVWGLLRPPADARGARVAIEFAAGGADAFEPLAAIEVTDAQGAFATTLPPLPAGGRLRATWQPPAPPAPPRDPSPLAGPPPAQPPPPPAIRSHAVRVTVG